MSKREAKMILKKIKQHPKWHHDIKYIGAKFIEDVVSDFQAETEESKQESILLQILKNYEVFRDIWARALAPYLYNDLEEAAHVHDLVIWMAAKKFDFERAKKEKGYAFNAYIVSCLMNALKNNWNSKMSPKNSPHIKCPVCGETMAFIDERHLTHQITRDRYMSMFPGYSLFALNGKITDPVSEKRVLKVKPYTSSVPADRKYTLADFYSEFPECQPKPTTCPVTGQQIEKVTPEYASFLLKGYTSEEMMKDFPEWDAIIVCPFTGKRVFEVTEEHLNSKPVKEARQRLLDFSKANPNFTFEARRVQVLNPYTNEMVEEITPEMLAQQGTTLQEHLHKYATVILDKAYPKGVTCPLTGKKTTKIKREHLQTLGFSSMEFWIASCQYPLKRWQVKCAICGEWTDNIWSHLEAIKHTYARPMTMSEYEQTHGKKKNTVSNNSFVEDEEGDSIHIADLAVIFNQDNIEKIDIEDALEHAANDDLDIKIAHAIRNACNFEDICHLVCDKQKIVLGSPLFGQTRQMKKVLKDETGFNDFDLVSSPEDGSLQAEVMLPSKDTIKRRMTRMMEVSGVGTPTSVSTTTATEHNAQSKSQTGQRIRKKRCWGSRLATA